MTNILILILILILAGLLLLLLAALLLLPLFMIMPRLARPAVTSTLLKHRYAHRGLHNIKEGVPENSMMAFRLALEQGFGMELDIHLSKDGKLVVEHDDTLTRTCGTDWRIEDTAWEQLCSLSLEGTDEKLPLLEEVLALVGGKVPLILELKVVGGNHNALAEAVAAALKGYEGLYCVESFDPRAIFWFRRHAPHIVRGQLAGDVRKEGSKVSPVINFALKNLWVNAISRPDFVAYHYKDCKNLSFGLCRTLFRAPVFFWTIRSKEALQIAERYQAAPIFEDASIF